jgi:hypothetical protein
VLFEQNGSRHRGTERRRSICEDAQAVLRVLTFTVPEGIREVLRGAQKEGYDGLFDAASQAIRDVGSATKSLRDCRLGYFGVLHT